MGDLRPPAALKRPSFGRVISQTAKAVPKQSGTNTSLQHPPPSNSAFALATLYPLEADATSIAAGLSLDVVAIHSVGQDGKDAWVCRGGGGIKRRSLPIGGGAAGQQQYGIHRPQNNPKSDDVVVDWLSYPKMLPDKLGNARIMRFDYPSNAEYFLHDKRALFHTSQKLLEHLNAARVQCQDRPLVFIAYGFGGIVLQQFIVELQCPSTRGTKTKNHLSCDKVAGIVFLATPENGVGTLFEVAGGKPIGSFHRDLSGKSNPIQDRRIMVLREAYEKVLSITNIQQIFMYEELPTIYKDKKIFVVQPPSARDFQLRSAHKDMARCNGPSDDKLFYISNYLLAFKRKYDFVDAAKCGRMIDLQEFLNGKQDFTEENRFKNIALWKAVENNQIEAVEFLLEHGANPDLADPEGKTSLYKAMESGHEKIVERLLTRGASLELLRQEINSLLKTKQGEKYTRIEEMLKTPYLIKGPKIEGRDPLDPQQRTAGKAIKTLMPEEQVPEVARLGQEAMGSCGMFRGLIVNFCTGATCDREFRMVQQPTIKSMLYEEIEPVEWANEGHTSKDVSFNWYHIPANNWHWVKDLFARLEIQHDLGSLLGERRIGSTPHSQYMVSAFATPNDRNATSLTRRVNNRSSPAGVLNSPSIDSMHFRGRHRSVTEDQQVWSDKSALFFSYFNVEKSGEQQRLNDIIKSVRNHWITAETPLIESSVKIDTDESKSTDIDGSLIKAYLPSTALHVRRTLDQYHYTMLEDTSARDKDQVLFRHQKASRTWEPSNTGMTQNNDTGGREDDFKILMVDQIWLWIIGDTLITSFPQNWKNGFGSKEDVLQQFLQHLRLPQRDPILSVYDLAVHIIGHCTGIHGPPGKCRGRRIIDIFNQAIGRVASTETDLFKEYTSHLQKLDNLMKEESKGKTNSQEQEEHLNALNNNTKETNLLKEVKDILDELNILHEVFGPQEKVVNQFCDMIRSGPDPSAVVIRPDLSDATISEMRWQADSRSSQMRDIRDMINVAKDVQGHIEHLLDLKQKQSNASEAFAARRQAEESARQGNTFMVFTIITIIFSPLSFMASFFALNINEYPKQKGSTAFSLVFASEWIFGLSAAIAVPLIILAFKVNTITSFLSNVWSLIWYPVTEIKNTKNHVHRSKIKLALWRTGLLSSRKHHEDEESPAIEHLQGGGDKGDANAEEDSDDGDRTPGIFGEGEAEHTDGQGT